MIANPRLAVASALATTLIAFTSGPARALDANIDVITSSGVAPLAVFFDARGTTDPGLSQTQLFLDAAYQWDFGDGHCEATGDVWIHSGRSKCEDLGPIAGHVYEKPGSYTATLLVEHGTKVDTEQIQITVSDPDVVFSGQNTVCISTSGDFSDPNGVCNNAQRVVSTDRFENLRATYATGGKRVLFRRGESWTNTASWRDGSSAPVIIGAYGVGPKPVIRAGAEQVFTFGSQPGLRVMDLMIQGSDDPNTGSAFYSNSKGQAKDTLILRVDVRDMAKPYQFQMTSGPTPLTSYMNNGVAVIDSTSTSRAADSGNNDWFGGGERLLFMGNNFGDADGTEHTLRFTYVKGAVISHNAAGRSTPGRKHVIKMHNGFDGATTSAPCTEEVVLADNRLDAGFAENALDLGPQNDSSTGECVRLIRVERNHIVVRNSTTHSILRLRGGENLVANNIIDMSGSNPAVFANAILVGKRGGAQVQPASDNRILNNTCYKSDGLNDPNDMLCVGLEASSTQNLVANNLLYAPKVASKDRKVVLDNGSGNTLLTNQAPSSAPFVSANPKFVGDFKLGSGGAALIDAGTNPGSTLLPSDFSADYGSRIVGNVIDVGAFEDRGSAAGLPAAPILLPD